MKKSFRLFLASIMLIGSTQSGHAKNLECPLTESDLSDNPSSGVESQMLRDVGYRTGRAGLVMAAGSVIVPDQLLDILRSSRGFKAYSGLPKQARLLQLSRLKILGVAGGVALLIVGTVVYFFSDQLSDAYFRPQNSDGTVGLTPSELEALDQKMFCLSQRLDQREQSVKKEDLAVEKVVKK
jgi:hypothetical protein